MMAGDIFCKMRCLKFYFCLTLVFLSSQISYAVELGDLPIDTSNFIDPSALITKGATNSLVLAIGMLADHRPFEPATGLGFSIGLDVGLSVILYRVPNSFADGLSTAEFASGTSSPPFIGIPKLHIHKGLGLLDVGLSYIGYKGYKIYGADIKVPFVTPDFEEGEGGPTWAFRLCYGAADVKIIEAKSVTPQVLLSRKLSFADPYIGVGYQIVTGKIGFSIPLPSPLSGELSLSNNASVQRGYMGFFGIEFQPKPVPLDITIEFSFHQLGYNSAGLKFGFFM
jgi:hypothetical protein